MIALSYKLAQYSLTIKISIRITNSWVQSVKNAIYIIFFFHEEKMPKKAAKSHIKQSAEKIRGGGTWVG